MEADIYVIKAQEFDPAKQERLAETNQRDEPKQEWVTYGLITQLADFRIMVRDKQQPASVRQVLQDAELEYQLWFEDASSDEPAPAESVAALQAQRLSEAGLLA